MFQNNTNICCYTISLFHTHILSCRQRCPQALHAPWPLSFTGTSPVSPMASHPVGTLCWSDAPWAHQKDWKPHLLGSLHTPGMNPERKTDVSLAETYLSQGSYWPACLQTHPEDLTMTPTATACAAVPQGGWLWATEPLPSGGPCRTASTPMLCLHRSGSRAPSWGAAVCTLTFPSSMHYRHGPERVLTAGGEAESPQVSPGPSHWLHQAQSPPAACATLIRKHMHSNRHHTNCTELIQ